MAEPRGLLGALRRLEVGPNYERPAAQLPGALPRPAGFRRSGVARRPSLVGRLRRPGAAAARPRGAREQLRSEDRDRARRAVPRAGRCRRVRPLSARGIRRLRHPRKDLRAARSRREPYAQRLLGRPRRGLGNRRLGSHPPLHGSGARGVSRQRGGSSRRHAVARERRRLRLLPAPRARSPARDRALERGNVSADARPLHATATRAARTPSSRPRVRRRRSPRASRRSHAWTR